MQHMRSPFSSSHRKRIIVEALINRKDQRSPVDVRFLEDFRESAEGGLRYQAMKGVHEVIDERNAASPAEPNSCKPVEDTQTNDDIRSKFANLPPNLEAV